MNTTHYRRISVVALAAASAIALSSCATTTATETVAESPAASSSRVAVTYDGGILVLDGTSLEVEGDLPLDGYNRVNPGGDGSSVYVSTEGGFRVLDTAAAELTDLVFPALTPGHAVLHGDQTILFDDGTGDITVFESAALLDAGDELPEVETVESEAAHHGVAIELEDGRLLSTLGDAEGRTGVRVLDAAREETDRAEDCPGVHGEGTTKNEVAVFGCNDGVLVYDGEFTKVASPDAYGRIGNQFTTETSTVALGDYNSDPDAEGYLLSAVSLIDTVAKTIQVVDLPVGVEYTFRDLARGPGDEGVILGTDGSLHVIDVETGEITTSYPVIGAWEGPAEWQDSHPALKVLGDVAYVTEPATDSVFAVDLGSGDVLASAELPATPNELAVVASE
ncbi:hypothetical protein HD599_002656 [Conyzicola lurida]|uniref:Secreted protein n=1 Tax=Conyzicola lurida TaxID=1172621 RepID=A0A841ARY5_9MICO|nr:zinc metallochaperone AztD [Conyzicola lurida]MBB5844333.1 hypothetical protein [Conyzicola lurida]